jgi:hypothetical protein
VTTLREDSIGIYKEWLDAQFYIKKNIILFLKN